MTQAVSAQGTKLYRGATTASSPNTPTGFTASLPEIKDFQGPGGQSGEIEVTSLDSTAKEFLPALKDNGQFTANMNFAPSSLEHQGIVADQENRVSRWYRLVLPNGANGDFQGFVQQFTLSGAVDNVLAAALTVRVAGAITWDWPS